MLYQVADEMISNDFVCYYETGIDEVREFDAHMEIYAKSKHIKVTYDTYVPDYGHWNPRSHA